MKARIRIRLWQASKPRNEILRVDSTFYDTLSISATNDQVHAAGAFDVDFKTDVAARSRATPGYPTFRLSST